MKPGRQSPSVERTTEQPTCIAAALLTNTASERSTTSVRGKSGGEVGEIEAVVSKGDWEDRTAIVDAIKAHPLFPLLELLAIKCEMAMRLLGRANLSEYANVVGMEDVKELIVSLKKKHGDAIPTPEVDQQQPLRQPHLDEVIRLTICELRHHLAQLAKVWELCEQFYSRYIELFNTYPIYAPEPAPRNRLRCKRALSSPESSPSHSSVPGSSSLPLNHSDDPDDDGEEIEGAESPSITAPPAKRRAPSPVHSLQSTIHREAAEIKDDGSMASV